MVKQLCYNLKKHLKLCGFLLLLIISNITSAASGQHDAVLDSVLTQHCRFSGTFTQEKSLTSLPVALISTGKFLFDCDLGLIWHTAKPIVETKIYTTSSMHFHLDAKSEMEVLDDVIQTTIAKLLLDIMSANKEAITEGFVITPTGTNSISLVPMGAFLKKGLQSISLKKNPAQNTLLIGLLDKKSQNTRITSVKTHQSESKEASLIHCQSLFNTKLTCAIFEKPSNYEASSE